MNKTTRRSFFLTVIPLVVLAAGATIWLNGCGRGDAVEPAGRADLIIMDGLAAYGPLERPVVQFPHDLHTKALAGTDEDCSTCHPQREDGKLSQLYMRTADGERDDLEDLYHTQCMECHSRKEGEGIASGPVSCGGCHNRGTAHVSTRELFVMDKSLHYRHVKASEEKCETCHHVLDEATEKLVYKKDTESSCRDCHGDQTEGKNLSARLAVHQDCVGCHYQRSVQQPELARGPIDCAGCHDRTRYETIEVVADPPRLKRGQPDFVLLSAAADLPASKLNTVPFSHSGHEQFADNCRVCHHQTMAPCTKCHQLGASEDGGGITLQEAMHDLKADHSCVGCHERQKSTTACAGCHALMEQGRLSEHACHICHAGPSPDILESVRANYSSLDDFQLRRSDLALTFEAGEIPDTVSIGALSKEYPAVKMPHRKIIDALRKGVNANKVARRFHGHEDVLCQGCHHHGSIGRKPALCENCHNQPFDERNLFKPGLYSAYHRQCIGCHENMKMTESSKCETCHPKKLQTAGAN